MSTTDVPSTPLASSRLEFENEFYAAVHATEKHMALADIDEDDEEAQLDAYDERYHCETCLVRNVMDLMWPPIERYITALESKIAELTPEVDSTPSESE